jgi:hypothetical protein
LELEAEESEDELKKEITEADFKNGKKNCEFILNVIF